MLAAGLTQEERAQREVYANSGLCVSQISPQGKGYRISFLCLCGEARRLTQQISTHWPQFKALRQRYAGRRFEEQRQLHMPQTGC